MNRLYFGDNLEWLRNTKEFPDASVDLVYLDPPFNSRMRIRKCTPAQRSQSRRRVRQLLNEGLHRKGDFLRDQLRDAL